MRKTALVITLVAAAAAFTWANAATVAYKANLAGAAEVPPVQSTGKGTAQVNVDTATKQATWRVEYTGLSGPAAAAHIHCGAAAGDYPRRRAALTGCRQRRVRGNPRNYGASWPRISPPLLAAV